MSFVSFRAAHSRIRQRWALFAGTPPGERFQRQYERRRRQGRHRARNFLDLALGSVLLGLGLLLLVTPGPGLLLIAVGLSRLAHHSLRISRGLDRLEVLSRRAWHSASGDWRSRTPGARIGIALTALLPIAGLVSALAWLLARWAGTD